IRDPRFLTFFYMRQNLQALVDGRVNHGGPVWYYLPILLGAFLPFALLVGWALGVELWTTFRDAVRAATDRTRARSRPDPARLYLGCMVLPPLVLLSQTGLLVVAGVVAPFVVKDEALAQFLDVASREGATLVALASVLIGTMLVGGLVMSSGRTLGGMAVAAAGSIVVVLVANDSALDIGGERETGTLMQKLM